MAHGLGGGGDLQTDCAGLDLGRVDLFIPTTGTHDSHKTRKNKPEGVGRYVSRSRRNGSVQTLTEGQTV